MRHENLAVRMTQPGSPSHAGLLRIVLGAHLLAVMTSPALSLLLDIEPGLHPQSHVVGGVEIFSLLSTRVVEVMRASGVVFACLVILGFGGRWSIAGLLVSFLITQLYWFGATLFHDDWIYFIFPLLALLTLTESTAYSVDGWLRRRDVDSSKQTREARFLVEAWVFWIGFVYLAAGLAKVFPLAKGMAWLSGRAAQEFAIEFVLQSPALALFGQTLFPYEQRWIFMVGSVLTVLVELGAVMLWFSRSAYAPLALAIFSLHLGIWLIGIPAFIGMFSVLALALLPRRGFARLDEIHAATLQRSPTKTGGDNRVEVQATG